MNFIKNDTIDPFAMYIFEFSHVLKKQDLANIWQNLYPEIGQTFETAESSISHELLAHELLGGGAVMTPEETLDVNAVGNELPDRVQWMVFKVKQRAETNYYSKIIGRQVESRPQTSGGGAGGNNMQTTSFNVANLAQTNQATVTSEGLNTDVSYNWPYDFFSLVELAKIESEVKFAEKLIKPGQEPVNTTVPIVGNNNNSNPLKGGFEVKRDVAVRNRRPQGPRPANMGGDDPAEGGGGGGGSMMTMQTPTYGGGN